MPISQHTTAVHNHGLSRSIAIGHQIDVRLREILRLADTTDWQGRAARGVERFALESRQVAGEIEPPQHVKPVDAFSLRCRKRFPAHASGQPFANLPFDRRYLQREFLDLVPAQSMIFAQSPFCMTDLAFNFLGQPDRLTKLFLEVGKVFPRRKIFALLPKVEPMYAPIPENTKDATLTTSN